ncbi:hypothetical protein HDU76_002593, partial [Blyttiomyces sp. JEL0837]
MQSDPLTILQLSAQQLIAPGVLNSPPAVDVIVHVRNAYRKYPQAYVQAGLPK